MTKVSENGTTVLDKKKTTKKEDLGVKNIVLPELDFKQITLTVEGIAPLIVNNFSEKAQQMMLDKQTKKASKGREAKNPEEQYLGSLYMFPDKKRTGFPAVGFKAAMVRAGKLLGMPMTDTRGKFHILPSADGGNLVQIKGKYSKRTDTVILATGVADIRFRAEYELGWTAEVTIMYNATWISQEQIAQLLNTAGFSCGIGEWRPEKSNSGSFGLFRVK